jgi:hypothetical protein
VGPQQAFQRRSVPSLGGGDERGVELGPVDRGSVLR